MWNLIIIERDGRNTATLAHLFSIVFFLGSACFTTFCYHVGLKKHASTDIGGGDQLKASAVLKIKVKDRKIKWNDVSFHILMEECLSIGRKLNKIYIWMYLVI